ncbi:hypothetical protein [Mycobacterium paraterrae]|uniref:Mammalian cell entry protein n=1 Tax=Mycobacterium paraterrae TaxID=577492 RepID=A0ABY3VSK6_9MYCO|nr:hypothetical protein [Mycobacterium paraterrae]UMB70494.1 hypothetical protein MKK62_03980 [Mycobacterium paraterrae]
MTDSDRDPSSTQAPDPLAEAEDELARAEERAAAARARAAELRREAEAEAESGDEPTETDDDEALTPARWRRRPRWSRKFHRPSWKATGVGFAITLVLASLAGSAVIEWQHRELMQRQQRAVEYATAARDEVTELMTIDPSRAAENLQRTIDDSTGALKSQLQATSGYMVKNAQDAQITTKATVTDVAVESMTGNSAVVLVVAKSDTVNADKSQRPSVFWRISVNIERDGDRLKMSKLDFVQ